MKGVNGQVIKPKTPALALKKKPAESPSPTPATEADKTAEIAAEEAAKAAAEAQAAEEAKAAEEARLKEEEEKAAEEARRREEEEKAAEEARRREEEERAAAEAAAEEARRKEEEERAAAAAQYEKEMEEYNRQMEEYNRQMEEYNRHVEEQARQEAAEAAASREEEKAEQDTPEPKPAEEQVEAPPVPEIDTPAAKITKAAIAAKKAKVPQPPVPAPKKPLPTALKNTAPHQEGEGTPEDANTVDAAYVAQLQKEAAQKPIYKRVSFLVACGALIIVSGICGMAILNANAEKERMIEQNARIMAILKRAQAINREQVETLAQAKEKGIDVKCSLEDAQFLMDVVVNPTMKDEKGKPMFGSNPDGTAQLACVLIGIACESNNKISKAVFERLDKAAPQIKPSLYRWLIQRLAVADIKNINTKLRNLADAVSKQNDPKFRKRNELLSYIWEAMGLRVTEEDIPTIIKLLKDPELDNMLGNTLLNCLNNIVRMTDDAAKKSELGDKIFDTLPEKMRPGAADVLAATASPKALEYFKGRAADPQNWRTDRNFFANYANDDILPFLEELRLKTGGDKRHEANVQSMITGLFLKNRDRTLDQARRFFKLIPSYDKVDMDTSDWAEINAKTDPDSADYIGDNNPQYAELMKRKDEIEASRKQKFTLISQLSGMFDYAWVRNYLDRFSREPDKLLADEAAKALEKVKRNRENEEKLKAKYDARKKK